jgi:NADPH:quinone reductase-like Zn-dependent oxidoreductase
MIDNVPSRGLRLTSTLTADGTVELELADVPVVQPEAGQVVVRIEAAPVNPSDLITLLASADPAQARFAGSSERPKVMARIVPEAVQARSGRIGRPLPVGLEGAGVVIAAGENAQALLGKRVAVLTLARGLFAQYCTVSSAECVLLPEGTTAAEGAGIFVNPLTALAIVETVRQEGYAGLVHTAAASNLGQILLKICQEDGIPLVNVVRRKAQAELLRGLGATHVCDSSAPSFREDLVEALKETGATVAFDAIGGGTMADEILQAMEAVAASRLSEYSPYGSSERKQVYIYGLLDTSPTQLAHTNYGLIWGVSGWVMPPILERAGPERAMALRQRVVDNLKTTFRSHYTRTISLAEVLQRDVMIAYSTQATGEKYLIDPTL